MKMIANKKTLLLAALLALAAHRAFPQGYEVPVHGMLVATFEPLGEDEVLAYEPTAGRYDYEKKRWDPEADRAGIYAVNTAARTKRLLGTWKLKDNIDSPAFTADRKQCFFTPPHTLFSWHRGNVWPLYRVDGTAGTVEYVADVGTNYCVSGDGAYLLSTVPLPLTVSLRDFFAVLLDLRTLKTVREFEWHPENNHNGNGWYITRSERGFYAYYKYEGGERGAQISIDVSALSPETVWDTTAGDTEGGRDLREYPLSPRDDRTFNMALGGYAGYAELPPSTELADFPASHRIRQDTDLYDSSSERSGVSVRLSAGTPVLALQPGEHWSLVLMVSTGEAGWCISRNLEPVLAESPAAAVEMEAPGKGAGPLLAESPASAAEAEAPKKSAGPLPSAALAAVPAIAALLLLAAWRRKRRRQRQGGQK